MTATEVSLRDTIAEIYEPGLTTLELAETASAAASEDANRAAMLHGWQHEILKWEAAQWRRSHRSGHENQSAKWDGIANLPGRGILAMVVRTNDGQSRALADVDHALAVQLKDEYGGRKLRNAAGEKFFAGLAKNLTDGQTVSVLGEERVEALAVETGYRV